jgi:hypothetical protein
VTARSTRHRRAAALLAGAALALLPACGTSEEPAGPAPADVEQGGAPHGGAGDTASPPPQDEGGPGEAVTEVELSVSAGQVEGVDDRVETPVGSTVRLVVTSDEADELHVHGYDLYLGLSPGEPATMEFVADIPGVFEAELHDSGAQLFLLQVG